MPLGNRLRVSAEFVGIYRSFYGIRILGRLPCSHEPATDSLSESVEIDLRPHTIFFTNVF
jgi:hypothetical protein